MIKKIFLYYPSFERGGATINLINIINFFAKKKIKIYLFSNKINKKNNLKSSYLKIVKSKPLKMISFFPIRWNLALSSALNLNKFLKKNTEKKSIIFSMQSHIPAIVIAKLNKKIISIRNSEEPLGATYYADNKVLAFLVLILKFLFYNLSDQIIAISKKSQESLKKIVFIKNKVVLIYNPYLINILKSKKKIKTNKFIILTAGRITKQKNLNILINAFNNLSKKYKNLELIITGQGDLLRTIYKKVRNKNNIKVLKWKKNLGPVFRKSNLFVLSSYYEGLPNILIDAVNHEVPCIATDVSGVRDILVNGKGGLIIPNNDVMALEKSIEYSIHNYSKLRAMISIAKKNLFMFTKKNCAKIHDKFNELLNYN